MPSSDPAWVLDEDEALELLAYLLTAARTQVDEAAEYGPLRLLTAAHRLADRIAPRSSDETAAFIAGPLEQGPELAVPREAAEPQAQLEQPLLGGVQSLGLLLLGELQRQVQRVEAAHVMPPG